jgi:ribosomal protein S18 acetylase RimI-like enzyme
MTKDNGQGTTEMTIRPARAEEWPAALAWLFAHLPPDRLAARSAAALAALDAESVRAAALLVAVSGDGRLVGAVAAETLVGPAVEVMVPGAADGATADALLRHALDVPGLRYAQCLPDPDELPACAALHRCGFEHVTSLMLMARPSQPPFTDAGQIPGIDMVPLPRAEPAHVAAALAAAEEASLDVPELTGLRPPPDGAGRGGLLALAGDVPAGAAVVTDEADGRELTYLGVSAPYRRRGLGRALVAAVLADARAAGVGRVTLAVDARNVPAVGLYAACGFVETGRREVLLWRG